MKVAIIGPNLLDQTRGGIHIHKFGCADTHKREYRFHRADTKHAVDVDTRNECVTYVYDPGDFDYDEDNANEIEAYASDIYFYPCTNDLPWKH